MEEPRKKVKYRYTVEADEHVLLLAYLSHIYRIDLEMLLLLYDKLGKNVFYILFLFSGKSLVIPKHTKMLKIRNFIGSVAEGFKKGSEIECSTNQEKSFMSFISSIYDESDGSIHVDFEIPVEDNPNA